MNTKEWDKYIEKGIEKEQKNVNRRVESLRTQEIRKEIIQENT